MSTLDLANLPRRPQGEVDFAQDFFGRDAFLTVSGELNVEAYCLALTKAYTSGPTFCAENSNTSRHLAEFWMIETEIASADLSDNAILAERLLKYTFETLLTEREEDLAFFDERIEKGWSRSSRGSSARSSCAWGVRRGNRGARAGEGEIRVRGQVGHRPAVGARAPSDRHERHLTEKHAKKPVIVMNYPTDIKTFYMWVNDDGRTVATMDVIARIIKVKILLISSIFSGL